MRETLTHLHAHRGSRYWKWGPAQRRSWICWATAGRRRTAGGWAPSCSIIPTPSCVPSPRPRCSSCHRDALIRRERDEATLIIWKTITQMRRFTLGGLTYKRAHRLPRSGHKTRTPLSRFGRQIHTTDCWRRSCSTQCSGHLIWDREGHVRVAFTNHKSVWVFFFCACFWIRWVNLCQ